LGLPDIKTSEGVVGPGDSSVEVLLPIGGSSLQLSCSGWSSVVRVDAEGGPPHRDFSNEGGCRVTVRRRPYRLFAVLAGAISDLNCEADDELRPLGQVLAPKRDDLEGLAACLEATAAGLGR
jgi:hypothetical protein